MGFKEEVEAIYQNSGPPKSGQKEWLLNQLGDEAKEFEDLVADPKVHALAIHEALTKRGYSMRKETIRTWCYNARNKT